MATTNLGKVSVTPKGEYDPLISYERLDIVNHNGSSYIVKQTSMGVTPNEGEFYALIAEKGDGGSFVKKAYKTYAAMDADKVNIPANSSVDVTNDLDGSKNGAYIYDGAAFTRSQYDSKVVTDKIIADTAIAVQDAINNTAVEGGVLADTFVTATANAVGAIARTQRDKNRDRISVKDFGAKGNGVTDDTNAFNTAFAYLNSRMHLALYIPSGHYKVGELIPIESETFTLIGDGSANTIIESSRVGGNALSIDAWTTANIPGAVEKRFMNASQIGGFRVISALAETLLYARGLARSSFKDIRLNGTDRSAGTKGLHVASTQLCYFENIYCAYPDGATPENGIFISNAPLHTTADGVQYSGGLPSNNTFINVYPEGCDYGIMLANGDQNIFIGGSPEGATKCSLTIGANCRYNTFISMGFESKDATGGEIYDGGEYTKYINCYASNINAVALAGRGTVIDGGYYQKITLYETSKDCTVENISIGPWYERAGDNGGVFVNVGVKGARFKNIYEPRTGKNIHPKMPRYAVTPTGTPFEWENLEGVPVKFMIIDGAVTQIMIKRGTDQWFETVPPETGRAIYSLLAGDIIVVSYVGTPTIEVIPQNGI